MNKQETQHTSQDQSLTLPKPIAQATKPLEPVATQQLPEIQAPTEQKPGERPAQPAQHNAQRTTALSTTPHERAWGLASFFNSPWLLVMIPLMAGAVWLACNTWVITNNLDKPYMLAAGPAAVGSVVVGWIVIKFFTAILSACKAAWAAVKRGQEQDSSAQFFWVVIIVFMIVSVFASGTFFNTLEHNALPGLGYVTGLFIDLVAVQAMRARLNAVRMRDKRGSSLYLFGVLLCAGASAFANVYTSLADFDQHLSGALPSWMLFLAPWFGLVFPALILLLSITADYTLDQISTKLDPEQYREQEAKRIKLLEYQRDALRERMLFEQEIDQLNKTLQSGKERRVFFLINWLFPVRRPLAQTIDTQKIMEDMLAQIRQGIDAQKITASVTDHIRPWFEFFDGKYVHTATAIRNYTEKYDQLFHSLQKQQEDIDTDLQLLIDGMQNLQIGLSQTQKTLEQEMAEKTANEPDRKKGNAKNRLAKNGKNTKLASPKMQKNLNFTPNAFHQKAVGFLRYSPHKDFIGIKIRTDMNMGYEDLAAHLRQQSDLNYSFVTAQFAAEVWTLHQIEEEDHENQANNETRSSSPSSEKRDMFEGSNNIPLMKTLENAKKPTQQIQISEQAVTHHLERERNHPEEVQKEVPQKTPQESERGNEKDEIIQETSTKNDQFGETLVEKRRVSQGEVAKNVSTSENGPENERASAENDEIVQNDQPKVHVQTIPRGKYTMSITEVAEQFQTTTQAIEDAIEKGILKISKRNKIYVSSLQNFSPPRKRGRRPTKQLDKSQQEMITA